MSQKRCRKVVTTYGGKWSPACVSPRVQERWWWNGRGHRSVAACGWEKEEAKIESLFHVLYMFGSIFGNLFDRFATT